MKEKVHADSTKAAKTPLMIYYAKLNDNILWIHSWQNEHQRSVIEFWSWIIGTLGSNSLQPFINAVRAGFIGKRERHRLPAPFFKWKLGEGQRILVL